MNEIVGLQNRMSWTQWIDNDSIHMYTENIWMWNMHTFIDIMRYVTFVITIVATERPDWYFAHRPNGRNHISSLFDSARVWVWVYTLPNHQMHGRRRKNKNISPFPSPFDKRIIEIVLDEVKTNKRARVEKKPIKMGAWKVCCINDAIQALPEHVPLLDVDAVMYYIKRCCPWKKMRNNHYGNGFVTMRVPAESVFYSNLKELLHLFVFI